MSADTGIDLQRARALLLHDELVAIPTETVYGLAGNALSEEAILKIYEVKNRPRFDPLIAHTDSFEKIKMLTKNVPLVAEKLAERFWPGPLTLLLEKKEIVPDTLTSGLARMAVRIPDHPLTRALLRSLDFPLAAPSANPFGYVSPTSAEHVCAHLGTKINYILDGGSCAVGVESTIVGFEDEVPTIYRLGGISEEELKGIVGEVKYKISSGSNPTAPGMLHSHYSPGRKIIIGRIEENLKRHERETTGIISFSRSFEVAAKNQFVLSERGDLGEAAKNIFSALRKMDQSHIRVVLCEYVPDKGIGRAINDRLKRAAA